MTTVPPVPSPRPAEEIRAALSAASPTTSDEPARCPHGELEPHPDGPDPAVDWCDGPGPAASGTPETTR